MTNGFDPYHKWLGIPPAEQPPNHYRLLGISLFESDLDVIANAADQRMSHVRTFQSGKRSADSQRLLNEISAAKVCLLNAGKKAAYDAQWRARMTQPGPAGPVTQPRAALPVAAPVAPQAVVEPSAVVEQGPSVAVPSRSSFRVSSARRQRLWQVWMATGAVIAVLIAIGAFVVISAGLEEVGQEGSNNPPVVRPKDGPKENPKDNPKPKPPHEKPEKPKPPPEKPKPKVPAEPMMGPVPDAAALKEARGQLAELLAGTSPSKLLAEAGADDRTRAQRYALLTRARELAAGAGDVKTALAVVDEMAKRFEIDAPALKSKDRTAMGAALKQLAEKTDTPEANQFAAENGLLLVEQAKAAGEKDLAKATAAVALSAARKSGNGDLVKRATLVFLEMQK